MKSYEIYSASDATSLTKASAQMCLPPLGLSGLIFATVERDTRELNLNEHQRFNYFPASALCSIVWTLEGQTHLISDPDIAPQDNPKISKLSFTGPFDTPLASWSAGPLHSICIGFYPESWASLTGRLPGEFLNRVVPLEDVVDDDLFTAFRSLQYCISGAEAFDCLDKVLGQRWRAQQSRRTHILSDWMRGLMVRAAMSDTGQSLRQMQRRLKKWTGLSRGALEKTARMESLHKEVMQRQDARDLSLALLAQDLGYSDQSHMGREFRKMTGQSPKKLGELVRSDENYWCYRLLGERFL